MLRQEQVNAESALGSEPVVRTKVQGRYTVVVPTVRAIGSGDSLAIRSEVEEPRRRWSPPTWDVSHDSVSSVSF
jgi:hypothetical protein